MFREESGDLDALGAHFNELDIAPPPLRHQRSQDHLTDVPMYRSLLDASMRADMSSHAPYEEYEEEPVYRSVFPHSGGHAGYSDDYHDTCEHRFLPEWGFLHADDPRHSKLCGDSPSCNQSGCGALLSGPSAFAFDFDFSPDIFDLVLNFLPCAPDLFCAMATNRTWRRCALDNYMRRCRHVPAEDDALLNAVEAAGPGDTIYVGPGVHRLSRELAITVPVRIIGVGDGDDAAVLWSEHVVMRTRAEAWLQGLVLCRMGDSVGYPNAVVFAEAGRLTVDSCRITCGGASTSVADVLRLFQGVPSPGEEEERPEPVDAQGLGSPWSSASSNSFAAFSAAAASEGHSQDRPQSGLWIGAAAQVTLRGSVIAGTMGPGVKVYRGELEAVSNTIAFSSRGANVVANGGKMVLCGNHIQGATGDGISSWNNTHMTIERNRICANSGSGITINSSGGRVHIAGDNEFSANGTVDVHRPNAARGPAHARSID